MSKPRLELVGRIVFIVLIVLFFFLYLRDIDYENFSNLSINWLYLILAAILSLGFCYWGVFIWHFILRDLGARQLPPFRILSGIYSKAWMARYLPGTIPWIAAKIYLASKLGISKRRVTVSSLVEGGMQIAAGMSISLLLLGFDARLGVISAEVKWAMVVIGITSVAALLPPVFNRVLGFAYKVIKRKPADKELQTNTKAAMRSYVLYAIGTFIMGTACYLLVLALVPGIGLDSYFYIVGTFSLAGAVGMAAPFVPSGLGVRDGIQLILLTLILPKEIALAITIFSRLWLAVIDVLFYLLSKLWATSGKF